MSKGKKTGGRDFTVGNPGGPGRRKVPEDEKLAWLEVKAMRNKLRYDWAECFARFAEMSRDEVTAFCSRTDVPVIEITVARAISRVYSRGNTFDAKLLQDMMCGPEPKSIELSGPGGEPLSPMAKLTNEQLVTAFLEVDRIVKESECKSTEKSQQSSGSSPPASRRSRATRS